MDSKTESVQDRRMRLQKDKMLRQFEAVPWLIFVYIAQLFSIFLYNLFFLNAEDSFSYEEKIGVYFLQGIFFLMYMNGIVKFTKSF
jgi:hypothetical protein